MRKLYTLTPLLLVILFAACSKDVFRSYDHRIVGTWRISAVDRIGIGARDNLPFEETGRLTFSDDGTVTYEMDGRRYNGSWDIIRRREVDEELQYALQLTVVDFNNQQMLSEYFNSMQFTGTNKFTAFLEYGTRTYVYRFRR